MSASRSLVVCTALTTSLVSCVLVTSFDDYSEHPVVAKTRLYRARGTVAGLDQGVGADLALNGVHLPNAGNGPFAFPASVADGAPWRMSATAVGFSCTARPETGVIAAADVDGVEIRCSSTDAALATLWFAAPSASTPLPLTLDPPFSPSTFLYRLNGGTGKGAIVRADVFAGARHAGAAVTIAGLAIGDTGTVSRFELVEGSPVDIVVTAADRSTTTTYRVTLIDGT
jgi:hypothetical protein